MPEETINMTPAMGMAEQNQEKLNEDLVRAYIGKAADKMYRNVKRGGVSIPAIIFGLIYYAYRKMYLVTFLIMLGSLVLVFCLGDMIGTMAEVFIGLMFCPLYKWDIERKLRKIKAENLNTSEMELLGKARNAGGTSWVAAIIMAVIIVTFVTLLILASAE